MRLTDLVFETSKPRPLYVCRPLVNTDDIIAWAKGQGLTSMLEPDDLHVTICYSKKPIDWDIEKAPKEINVPSISDFDQDHKPTRQMEMFGKEKNVLVLQLESADLHDRWKQFIDHGASYDFPEYKPHITISYKAAELAGDLEFIEPYRGKLVFGPEKFKEIDQEFAGDAAEIDLTKPLDELIEKSDDVSEAYLGFVGQNDVLIEHTEWAGGVRVTINPSLEQIETMCEQSDLRGVCDDRDTFVWDAGVATHLQVMYDLGIPTDYYVNRFFIWMPEFGEGENPRDDSSWLDSTQSTRSKIGNVIVSARTPALSRMMGIRSFSRMMRDKRLKEGQIEEHGGVRFTKNPTAKDLVVLMNNAIHKEGVRGITDGRDVFVWDAYHCVHEKACHLLGIDYQQHWKSSFYVADYNLGAGLPVAGSNDELWIICEPINTAQRDNLMVRSFARLIEPATFTELTEGVEISAPKYFWFITDVSARATEGEWKVQQERKLRELAEGVLNGMKGISGSREIVCQMLDIKGNAVVMMLAEEVLRYNDIEQVRYHDPHYLVANNMRALYRLWEKDSSSSSGRRGLMINLMQYVIGAFKKHDTGYIAPDLEALLSVVAGAYADHPFSVNNSHELAEAIKNILLTPIPEDGHFGYRRNQKQIRDHLQLEDLRIAVEDALKRVGLVYSDESEWLVHGDTFRIPPGSRLLISVDPRALKAARTGDMSEIKLFEKYMVENAEGVLRQVERYDLAARYQLRFVDMNRFLQIRDKVTARRRERRPL